MIKKIRKLKEHKGFKKYFANTSWMMGEKMIRLLLSLFVGIWVARYLGPEKYGLLSYAMSFVGIFSIFSTLGLDGIVIREFVNNKMDHKNIIGTSLVLKLFASFLVYTILFIIIYQFESDSLARSMMYIIAAAIFFKSFNVVDFYFQSQVLSKYVAFSNLVAIILSSVVKIILILFHAPLIAFAWILLFDSIVISIGFLSFFLKKSNFIFRDLFRFDKQVAISLLRDSWPMIFSGFVIAIYMKIDQVMIKMMLGSQEVGQYAVAVRLSEIWYFIPTIITASIFPAIINAKAINQELYQVRLQKLYDLMVWMAIAIAIPMTFMSDWIVHLLYGEQYHQAGSVLMIHIWAGIFVFLGIAFNKYLLNENLTMKALYRTFFGAIINVGLNYILIPIYGIQGAAIATLVGQFSSNYLYDFFDKDLHEVLKMKTKSFFPVHIIRGYR